METRDLRELVEFSETEPVHRALFESERLWSEILCLDRTHRHGPISDPESDAVFTVVAGEVVIQVDHKRKRLRQFEAAFVPARSQVSVTNASTEPAVVMIVAAPPPVPSTGRTADGDPVL
jgi:quercetin dioxygenase-like cupin family protein